ncbi:MAG: sulfatase-like hydrolase/transferase, partial [Gammaproteobacteria bacterium]
MSKPNFVMIVTDQHCASWLSCAGHPVVRTPNIDRLAERGVRFREFHTASPVCMPNRASILTGRYPSVHGLKYNGCALSNDARTFVETLADAGYDT